jgi:hypothetical protein
MTKEQYWDTLTPEQQNSFYESMSRAEKEGFDIEVYDAVDIWYLINENIRGQQPISEEEETIVDYPRENELGSETMLKFKNSNNIDDLIKRSAAEKRYDAVVLIKVFVDDTGNDELDRDTAYQQLKEYLENVPNAEISSIDRNFGLI